MHNIVSSVTIEEITQIYVHIHKNTIVNNKKQFNSYFLGDGDFCVYESSVQLCKQSVADCL